MADKDLTNPEKAAIVLMAIGEEYAGKILKELKPNEIQKLGSYASIIRDFDKEVIEKVCEEFYNQVISGEEILPSDGLEYIKNLLIKVLGPKKAQEILAKLSVPTDEVGLVALKRLDAETIANFIKHEYPQTIALILAHLEPFKGAEVLRLLPEKIQAEVSLRLAKMDRIPPGIIGSLNEILEAQIIARGAGQKEHVGGVQKVAEILNQVDRTVEERILEEIENINPELAEEIRQKMFVFEDLLKVDDRGIQALLKEITNQDLLLALKGADEEIREKFFKNMSSRAAKMLKEDLEAMGPVRVEEVEQAQRIIIDAAKRLEEEGKLIVNRGGASSVI